MSDERKSESRGTDGEPNWVDRHLPKILVAGAVICALGLVGRAMTG